MQNGLVKKPLGCVLEEKGAVLCPGALHSESHTILISLICPTSLGVTAQQRAFLTLPRGLAPEPVVCFQEDYCLCPELCSVIVARKLSCLLSDAVLRGSLLGCLSPETMGFSLP